jgi:hypothetical protein
MTDKKLAVLGGIAVLMVILAVITSNVPEKKGGDVAKLTYLVQGVNTDNIASIEVKSGDDIVTLKRKGGKFVVDQKNDYPALSSKVNTLISDVLDIRTIEMFTENAVNHPDLGVTEESAAYVVRFFKPDGSEITGVVIGRNKEQGQGLFVRLTSDDRVYVTLNRLNLSIKPVGYVDQSLISVAGSDIQWVKSSGDGEKYGLKKDDDGNIVLNVMPETKRLKTGQAFGVFNALTSLRFDDVVKEGVKKLTFDKKYICRLKGSTQYTLEIAADEDKTFVKCTAEFTDKSKITIERGGNETEEELKAKEDKLLARDAAREFTKKHAGWVYEISSQSADNLTKPAVDLYQDKDAEELPAAENRIGPTVD